MSLALTAIFSYSLGSLLTGLLCYTLINLVFDNEKGRSKFFEQMSKNYPYDWSRHCPVCADIAALHEKQRLEFEALLNDQTVYPVDPPPP